MLRHLIAHGGVYVLRQRIRHQRCGGAPKKLRLRGADRGEDRDADQERGRKLGIYAPCSVTKSIGLPCRPLCQVMREESTAS